MPKSLIINPLLRLVTDPKPTGITGGGKTLKQIKDTLNNQRNTLSAQLEHAAEKASIQPTFAEKTHLIAKMQPDSLAPTLTPNDLFSEKNNAAIVAPAYQGYLIEIAHSDIESLAKRIKTTDNTGEKVDISRLHSIGIFDKKEVLRGKRIEDLWDDGKGDSFQAFNLWLMPFKNAASRYKLAATVATLLKEKDIRLGDPEFAAVKNNVAREDFLQEYLDKGFSSLSIEVSNRDSLDRIAASGAIYRIEPCMPIKTTTAPGVGKEPTPKLINSKAPTVVVIDGGVSAKSYLPLERVKIPPLVPAGYADLVHGNKVASLICHAHAWNNNRPIPKLDCTFISAQVICKDSAPKHPNNKQLIDYLEGVAETTSGHSRVWNLSFNQIIESVKDPEVSYLGHHISKISRKHGILPVISIGNTKHNTAGTALCPPADCESALTVSARDFENTKTRLGKASVYSLHGPGPAGMIKPDLSWFGTLRMIGGVVDEGTSFCTPLVSSLAAHAFEEIKNSTPDLVRALLINRADLNKHCHKLGWGTPASDDILPWHCQDDTVTLAWTAMLSTGSRYYWHDIPIPKELIEDGKFIGTVALTAILKPIVSELGGDNYFSSRLETSLQASRNDGIVSLAGSMKESSEREQKSRKELAKWSPVRHHVKTHKNGTSISGNKAKVYARVFTRDQYQFENDTPDLKHEVSFVLTFKANSSDKSIYNSMAQSLGNLVESALVEQNIDIDNNIDN